MLKRLPSYLTVVSILLLGGSLIPKVPDIASLGLFSYFPLTYFLGLAFLTVASVILWVSKEYHPKLMALQLLMLIVGLWVLPVLMGVAVPFGNHDLRGLGIIEYIGRTGNLWSNEVAYLAWPGAFLLPGLLKMSTPINFEPLVSYAPFFSMLLCMVPLYFLLRNILGGERKNLIWVGMWIFCIANWAGEMYFTSTVGCGIFLLLVIYALLTSPKLFADGRVKWLIRGGLLVAYGYLVITHLLVSLVALCGIGVWAIYHHKRLAWLLLSGCIMLLIAWNSTGALGNTIWAWKDFRQTDPNELSIAVFDGVVSDDNGDVVLEIPQRNTGAVGRSLMLNPKDIISNQVFAHIAGSEDHIVVSYMRIIYSVIWVFVGGAGLVVALRNKQRKKTALLMLLMGLAPMVLVCVPYGGRIFHRLYMVSLIPLAYFGAVLFEAEKKWVIGGICALFILCIPLFIISNYGNYEFDEITPQQTEGVHYLADNMDRGYIIGLDFYWIISDIEKYHYIPLDEAEVEGNMFLPPEYHRDKPCYAIITGQERVLCDYIYDSPEFMGQLEGLLDDAPNCSLIYDNPDFEIYEVAIP